MVLQKQQHRSVVDQWKNIGAMPFRASVETSSQVAALIRPTCSAVQVAGKMRIMMGSNCVLVAGEYGSMIGRMLFDNYRREIRRVVGKHLATLYDRLSKALVTVLR